ncbi:MAG TPA: hypothetical protein GX717_09645 [Clostridiaceae bacterium]|nr:hypothetical protein [Clostridiaceae bacterium]
MIKHHSDHQYLPPKDRFSFLSVKYIRNGLLAAFLILLLLVSGPHTYAVGTEAGLAAVAGESTISVSVSKMNGDADISEVDSTAAQESYPDLAEERVWVNGQPIPDEVRLDVVHLRQRDERWNDVHLGGSASIGDEGCALTSLAMYGSLTMPEMTPLLLREDMGSDAYPVEWEAFAAQYDLRVVLKDDTIDRPLKLDQPTYVEDTIVRHLSLGRPVIVGIWHRDYFSTHYIIAYGYRFQNGADEIAVHDPSTNNDYQYLSDIPDSWGYCRLVVFAK